MILIGICCAGLGVGATYVYQQQQYIDGKGEQRDRENAREEQRINEKFCEVLALLPADSPLANEMRAELGCTQPGRAMEDYPPPVREQLARRGGVAPNPPAPAPAVRPRPELGTPAAPDRPPSASSLPAPTRPAPAPTEPAPAPLDPVTELVCDVTRICLESQ